MPINYQEVLLRNITTLLTRKFRIRVVDIKQQRFPKGWELDPSERIICDCFDRSATGYSQERTHDYQS